MNLKYEVLARQLLEHEFWYYSSPSHCQRASDKALAKKLEECIERTVTEFITEVEERFVEPQAD